MNKLKKNNQITNNSYQKCSSQQSKGNNKANESHSFSKNMNTFNNKNKNNTNENYDYENEDLNNHIEQSSYDEFYDSKNYSIHNFNNEDEN